MRGSIELRSSVDKDDGEIAEDRGEQVGEKGAMNNVHTVEQHEERKMGWPKATFLLLAETIALGVLSFPSICRRIGVVPTVISTIILAVIAWRTGIVIVSFKQRHPHVQNYADAGGVINRPLKLIFGVFIMLKGIFIAASHVSAGVTALSFFSTNSVCSTVFGVVMLFIGFFFSMPRKFDHTSYMSMVSVLCIITSCFITLVGVGEESKHYGKVTWKLFNNSGLSPTVGAATDIVFAYSGHGSIFTFINEMEEPKDFKKSLAVVQVISTAFYLLIGVGVYILAGDEKIISPALLIPELKVATAAYAIAMPTIVLSAVINVLVSGKFLITNVLNPEYLTAKSIRARMVWYAVVLGIWTASFIISQLIPFFDELLSLISSIISICLTYYATSILWFYDNKGRMFVSSYKVAMFVVAVLCVVIGAVITPLGIATSIVSIVKGFGNDVFGAPFTCQSGQQRLAA